MKRLNFKIPFLTIIAAIGVFGIVQKTNAYAEYQQPFQNEEVIFDWGVVQYFDIAGTPERQHTRVNSLDMWVKTNDSDCGYVDISLNSYSQGADAFSDTQNITPETWTLVRFDFTDQEVYLDDIGQIKVPAYTCSRTLKASTFTYINSQNPTLGWEYNDGSNNVTGTNKILYMIFNTQQEAPTENNVYYQTPQFANGFISNDFEYWWTCLNIIDGPVINSSYDVKVHYGQSTTTMDTIDSLSEGFGYISYTAIPVSDCPMIEKTATSSPGTYYSYLELIRKTSEGQETIATSSIIQYEIREGSRTYTAGEDTPSKTYTGTDKYRQLFQKKFPFEYIYQITDIFTLLQEADNNASITPLAITAKIATGITGTSTVTYSSTSLPFFNQAEMMKILPMSTWNVLQSMEGALIIIGTVWYVFRRLKTWKQEGYTPEE